MPTLSPPRIPTDDLARLFEAGRMPRPAGFPAVEAAFSIRVEAAGFVRVDGINYRWDRSRGAVVRTDIKAQAVQAARVNKRPRGKDPAARGVREHRVLGLPAGFVAARCSPTECGIVVGEF